jgi:hypothetical protein
MIRSKGVNLYLLTWEGETGIACKADGRHIAHPAVVVNHASCHAQKLVSHVSSRSGKGSAYSVFLVFIVKVGDAYLG